MISVTRGFRYREGEVIDINAMRISQAPIWENEVLFGYNFVKKYFSIQVIQIEFK